MNDRPDVLALFHSQRGVAHVDQLLALGIDRHTVWRARRRGALIDVLPWIVRLASARDTFGSRAMAVQLRLAPDGFLSGPTAARLRGVPGMPRTLIYATVPRDAPRQRTKLPGWVRRATSSCHSADDVMTFDGFRLQRPLPMLLSIATELNYHRFRRAAEAAWKLQLFAPPEADVYLAAFRGRGRAGVGMLERWLDETRGRARPMQSNFEIDVLDALRAAGLPEPEKQHPLRLASGEEIHLDLAWPEVKLAVEPGHSRWHDGDDDIESDRHRDNACGEVGWHIMRYSERARRNPHRMAAEVARTYRSRAAT